MSFLCLIKENDKRKSRLFNFVFQITPKGISPPESEESEFSLHLIS